MKALIFDNKVVEISKKEFEVHSGLSWVDCDDNVEVGDSYNGSVFLSNKPTQEEIDNGNMQTLRTMRNKMLADTDYWGLADHTMTEARTDYRQALRDITKKYKSLDDVKWPTKPS